MSLIIRVGITVAVLMGFASSPVYASGVVSPKSKKSVSVLQSASKGSKEIGTLEPGQELEASERKGMYWQVSYNGQAGFVSVMEVNRQASNSGSSLSNAIRNAANDNRSSDDTSGVRARSAVMGVRGLAGGSDVANAGSVTPNLRMVYAMEDISVSDRELEQFSEAVNREVEHRMAKESH